METNLLDLPTAHLMSKFGAGEHKPGSGSAAALQGILAAELIQTVLTLTLAPKRSHLYKNQTESMTKANLDIRDRILPRLRSLFEEDSIQFDRAIQLRLARDKEQNQARKKKLSLKATEALIPATEIPVEIAKLCEQLAVYAQLAFEYGFKSARGDSGVALNQAVSVMGGCLSIIDLNLLSFPPSKWTKNIQFQTDLIREDYQKLSLTVSKCLESIHNEVTEYSEYYDQVSIFKDKNLAGSISTDDEIERLVTRLQRTIWLHREKIWKRNTPEHPLKILDPFKAISIIGYDLTKRPTLGQYFEGGQTFEVAGLIDNNIRDIAISEQFSNETQLFTAAHELGHAVMHQQSVLHRDKPMDGSGNNLMRDRTEIQADKFAAYFLMPRKQVIKVFKALFLTDQFMIDETTAFALGNESVSDLKVECKSERSLSRKLASCEHYNSRNFQSLAQQFNVSVEAMAIRLEELDLLSY